MGAPVDPWLLFGAAPKGELPLLSEFKTLENLQFCFRREHPLRWTHLGTEWARPPRAS